MRLKGKTALVTGAARTDSIGRAIALALANEGADVAVNDFGRGEEAATLVEEITALGRRAVYFDADVREVAACRQLVSGAHAAWGKLDIVVNNAGFSRHQPFLEIEEADYNAMLDLNLKGPFFIMQAAARLMSAGGRIINISSEQAYIGHPTVPHYSAAKAGLMTMTRSVALALAPAITANCVAPGPTATARFRAGPEYTEAVRAAIPLERWVEPDDVARSVVFLASVDGDVYTGQILNPNAGTVMP